MMSSLGDNCCVPGADIGYKGKGEVKKIAGIDCYIVGDSPNAIILSTDVFGYQNEHAQYNADYFAEKGGFTVLIPDLFNGDSCSLKSFTTNPSESRGYLFGVWFPKHSVQKTVEIIVQFTNQLKGQGKYTTIQTNGYCYGAPHTIALTESGLAIAAVICHPSCLEKSDTSRIKTPYLFNCAETDQTFTPEIRQHFETELKDRPDVKFITYPGTEHGFAARGSETEEIRKQRTRALEESVAFFKAQV